LNDYNVFIWALGMGIKRREFITLLRGAAACSATWPLAARAQQPGKLPTLGFLGTVTRSTWPVESFAQRLQELGWIDGRTITVDYRWADGHADRIVEFAAEFVRSKVDLIVTGGNAVAAAKQATSTIPIVFAIAVDPVASGFVDSLSRPGGNVTGLSLQGPELAGKRLELLRQIAPGCRRLAIMVNVGYVAAKKELAQVQSAATALGFDTVLLEIRRAEDIVPALEGLMSSPRHWSLPTAVASIPWPWASGCRRSSVPGRASKTAVSSAMGQAFRPSFAAPRSSPTRFCAERNRLIFRSSSRRSSSSSSISRPLRRSGLASRQTCSRSPTR
jgi:hypothetical protein